MLMPRNTLGLLALTVVASQAVATNFQCPTGNDMSDIPIYVDTKDCRKFYNCETGVANHWPCADGFVFDPNMHYCVWSKECVPKFPFQCTNALRAESLYHADVNHPRQFYYCGSIGQTVRWTCADFEIFNPNTRLCEYSAAYALAGLKAEAAERKCAAPYNTSVIPNYVDPKDCRKFYTCKNGTVKHWPCTDGLVFDPNMHYCVWSKECVSEFPFQCTPALRDESFFHADVNDCHKFYYCGNRGQTVRWTCSDNQIFNPNTRSCVPSSECIKLQSKCPAELNGKVFYPDPKDCRKFFFCSAPNAARLHNTCPGELVFDADRGYCVTPELVPAGAAQSCKSVVKNLTPKKHF